MLFEDVDQLLNEQEKSYLSPADLLMLTTDPSRALGFAVDHEKKHVTVIYVDYGLLEPDTDRNVYRHSFLSLSAGPAMSLNMPARSPHPDCYRIGLSLAHSFPPAVEGTLTGTVHDGCRQREYLMSANHVIWMNGWAREESRIVLDPFGSPPPCTVGRVPPRNELSELRADKVNTHEEVCFGKLTRDIQFQCEAQSGESIKQPVPVKADMKIIRAGSSRVATVISTDFRFPLRLEFGRFLFSQQLLLGSGWAFADRGDSGALLFENEGYAPVAMLWAGMPDEPTHPQLMVATPLYSLFQERKLKFTGYLTPKQADENLQTMQQLTGKMKEASQPDRTPLLFPRCPHG